MKIYFTWLVCATLYSGVFCIHVNNVVVPNMVLLNEESQQTIVLDCQYDLTENTKSLVVKWFKDEIPIYQWIRGFDPTVYPAFNEQVNSPHSISSDPNQQYRALVLRNPTISATGKYKCVVQTDSSSSFKEKRLQIINTQNYSLNLFHHKSHNRTHLECRVERVYPKPSINFITDGTNNLTVASFEANEIDDGLFNATSIAIINGDYENNDEGYYRCVVTFMGLPYNITADIASNSVFHNACNVIFSIILPVLISILI